MTTALQFLAALYDGYPDEPLARCELRCIHPDRPLTQAWFTLTPHGLGKAVEHAIRLRDNVNVYMGVLPRRGNRGDINSVFHTGWLYADVDGGNQGYEGSLRVMAAKGLPDPAMAVISGFGIHAYWKLPRAVQLRDADERREFKTLLQRLVLKIGGMSPMPHADPAAADVARILRVPDTFNHKVNPPREVRLLRFDLNAEQWTLNEWDKFLPQPERKKKPEYHGLSGMINPGLVRWASEGYGEGKRHIDLTGAAAWLVRDCGLSKSDAAELLRMKAARSRGVRQITEEEIQDMVNWA